ncbi:MULTISPECIES: TraI domain-containing protein [Brenneria]|uniref:Relaxase n=1 Tax=Brenneria nigrifluens DSM 30175 = ATCC 13028 TaxID=1121120 RepID=A0A2U1UH43_9GAMM|nr:MULTISPECIES: TraI domain-containing protein [Brenneria]EHD22911.1 integrating conjugative element relaxase, PFGI-1 class [Brenneria sp. EniD312]PWC21006.1 relaxase [Brenneria nigrifluens] [Brenneria nigrifluens DSM 30175 = ATCC 13028]QCR06109.1 relaxase [Brenneria nigrifluens] [Brenneria nigrifluens DSM 30175 = ATCC 13028]
MLKAIRALLVGSRVAPAKSVLQSSSPACPAGYFMPVSAGQLLNPISRKQCLQQLWESSALPGDLYRQFYLQPLEHLVTLMQSLPATQQGEYAGEGGLAEVTLQTTTFAVRLARGHMLPPGAAPEDQSAQNVLWNAVIFYAALCRYLPALSQIEGELLSGRPWLPGLTVPGEPYRFRFRVKPPEPVLTTSQSALIAARLVPSDAIAWLSTLPAAAQALIMIVARQPSPLPVIDEIVREAVRQARGASLLPALPSGSVAIVSPVPLQTVTAAAGPLAPPEDLQSTVSALPTVEARSVESGPAAEVSKTPTADVLLSSALDEPVNDKPLAEMVVAPEPVAGTEEDMETLLSLMAVKVSAQVPAHPKNQEEVPSPKDSHTPVPDMPDVTEKFADLSDQTARPEIEPLPPAEPLDIAASAGGTTPAPEDQMPPFGDPSSENKPGEHFWEWLSEGLNSGEIEVNTAGARVHFVSGFVFITVPGIFYLYLKQQGLDGNQREALQEDFERLEKHRRVKGKRFYFAHLYESADGSGPYKRTKGYLIKASLLFRGKNVPDDSKMLVIP